MTVTRIVVGRIKEGKLFPPDVLRKIMENTTITTDDKRIIAGACEKAGRRGDAAKIYLELGMNKDAKRCAGACEKAGMYVDAARIYLELGMKKEAAEMQILAGNLTEATNILETMEAVNE